MDAVVTGSLGAGEFTPDPNNPFFLSNGDWREIRRYVITGSAMPRSETDLKAMIGVPATTDAKSVVDVVPVFTSIADHCARWQTTTYPELVTLASNLVTYGERAPLYYGNLQIELNKAAAGDTDARENAVKILKKLSDEADSFAKKSASAFEAVNQFRADTETDDQQVTALKEKYDQRYADGSAEMIKLQQDIDNARREMSATQSEYEHDVIVAATSPTYAWVFPFGTIAAVTVATVYGVRASKAKEKAQAEAAKLQILEDSQRIKEVSYALVKSVDSMIGDLKDKIDKALPVLQRLVGLWQSLRDRTATLADSVRDNIPLDDSFMASLGIQDAIRQWQEVAKQGNYFVANAYVVNQDPNQPLPPAAVIAISEAATHGRRLAPAV